MRFYMLAMLTLFASASLSQAQLTGPSAKDGKAIAEKLCISCHIVGTETPEGTVLADVPTFVSIANKPNQTAEAIAGKIVMPHPPMPQLHMTREQIADLATYILSLKK